MRPVRCYACLHQFQVGPTAHTARCPACTKHLNLRDVVVRRPAMIGRVETCGRVIVARRASLHAQTLIAGGGIEVDGRCQADAVCHGPVRLTRRARWSGDCAAPSIVIEPGAVIERGRFQISAGRDAPTDPPSGAA